MIVAVAGGGLQGVEAAYLARKAGWEVLLLDRKAKAPATGLCDRFVEMDLAQPEPLKAILRGVDLLIPAIEDDGVLKILEGCCRDSGVAFAFGPTAYSISSSKIASDRLFSEQHIPAPHPWPQCEFPVVAKPSDSSGSRGVAILPDYEAFRHHEAARKSNRWVIQEYIAGDTFSLEVSGRPGHYATHQVTDLYMDDGYDCKRVTAPTVLAPDLVHRFERVSLEIATAVGLYGLMDIEVVVSGEQLKVLEIDARLPSQTPTAVYWSTGLNLVQCLGDLFLRDKPPTIESSKSTQGVVYEHVRVTPGLMEVCGEHIMVEAGPLRLEKDFFGAQEALTNYSPERDEWVATLMISDSSRSSAWERREQTVADLRRHFRLNRYRDPVPRDLVAGES